MPTARRSVAGIVMLSEPAPPEAATYAVGRLTGALPPFTHWATEHGRILLPVTVNDCAALPTAAEVSDSEGTPGVTSAVVGVDIVNATLLEVPGLALAGSLYTETSAVPANAVSVGGIVAVS